jgi:5'-phosphate synthase pdxT subunit
VVAVQVRAPAQLEGLSHLILPGGESTTLRRLLDRFGLVDPLLARARAGTLALFGTCAGAILLARDEGEEPRRLGLLDVNARRNAYGTQLHSHFGILALGGRELACPFIRAPRLETLGPDVEILCRVDEAPVLVRAPGILAATCHPELTGDPLVHEAFLAMRPAAWSSTR